MKNRFLLTSLFLIGCTGFIQGTNSTPTVSRVYGDPFTAGVPDTQAAGTVGALVPTGVFGTNGSASINTQLSGGTAQAIQVLSDGTFITALSKAAANSVLAKYSSVGTIQSTAQFGTSGVADLGASTLQARAMMIDTQGRIVVGGGAASGTAGWLKRVSADGDTVQTFVTGTSWQYIAGVAEQTTGYIIAVGFNGTNAQIGRYTIGSASTVGILDTTFGTSGFTVFDGSGSVLPTATTGLYSVYVDSSNKIYVAFVASASAHSFTANSAYIARFTAAGALDTSGAGGWPAAGFTAITALNSATSGLYLAKDISSNLIVGAQVSANVKVTAVDSTGTALGGFTTFNTNTINGDTYTITQLITSSTGSSSPKIYVVGSDTTGAGRMAVIRLTGTTGALDTAFNTTGYNIFNPAAAVTAITVSTINGIGISPDGTLYTTGYQTDTGTTPTTQPYVSVIYSELAAQVAQSPATTEMGNLDLSFGTPSTETYAGVTQLFNGLYGPSLLQQANSVIEITTTTGTPAVGEILVGMNGKTNTSSSASMMFAWLTPAGVLDTGVSTDGYLTLTPTYTNEFLTNILQGGAGEVFVAGYSTAAFTDPSSSSTGAILRGYTSAGTTTWAVGTSSMAAYEIGAGYVGLAVGLQAFSSPTYTRVLFYVQDSATTGHLSAYTTGGVLDTSFGQGTTGSTDGQGGSGGSGKILTTAYTGMHMGPIYGGLVTGAVIEGGNTPIVAYKNSGSAAIDVAAFAEDGSALLTGFGTGGLGIATDVFTGHTISLNNVRLCFNVNGINNFIIVGAVDTSGNLLLKALDTTTGAAVPSWNTTGAVLSIAITGVTSGLQLKEITGVSDGMILATFYNDAADDTMYVARILAAGTGLDTTFNSQGSQPGVLPIQIGNETTDYSARIMTSSLVQSTAGVNQGNIVLAGYESVTSSDSTPMIMRTYGTSGTTEVPYYPITDTSAPGTFQASADLFSLLGTSSGKAIYIYPTGNTYQGYMLVGVDNGTDSKIARINISDNTLDSTFGTSGIYTITGKAGITCLTIDANNYILAGGTTSAPLGWAYQITPSATGGTPQIAMTMPSGSTTITGVNQIYQQKSGRYIVAAKGTNTATTVISVLVAFKDKLVTVAGVTGTTLVVDPTFNPNSAGLVPAGSYSLGTTDPGCYSLAINTNDTILAATSSAAGGFVIVTNVTANGSGNVSTFNSGGPLTTTVATDGASVCQVAIDSASKVVVAASYNSGGTHQTQVRRYTSAGANDGTWNTTGAVTTISAPLEGATGIVLADMMQTSTEQTILIGYNATGGVGGTSPLFASRLSSAGILDTTWNPSAVSPDAAGVLTYNSNQTSGVASATTLSDAAISINGTIVSIGSTAGTGGDPIVTFVYGDAFVTEVVEQPMEAAAGTLDQTIPGNVAGSLALASTLTGIPQRVYIYNSTINSSANGAMLVASVAGGNTVYITQLNADLTLNSANFGTSGVKSFTPNSALTPTAVVVTDMYVANGTNDTDQPIYVTGYTTTAGVNTMFAARLTYNGSSVTSATPITGLSATTASPVSGSIRQSSNSKVYVSGYNGTTGIVAAYNSAMNALDTSFGNHSGTSPNYGTGYYTTGVNNPIVAMTTDNSDRIYIAYLSAVGTVLNVDRLLANGTTLDTSFNSGGGTPGRVTFTGTAWSATQIKLAIDLTNSQLIIAAQDTVAGFSKVIVNRLTFTGATADASTPVSVAVASKNLSLSDLFIDNNSLTTGYPNIYVAGTNTTDSKTIVARIATTSTTTAIDSTYGSSGIANLTTGSMTAVTAAALDPDRRVYLVGSGGGLGYMGRNFGDYYLTERYPAILQGVVGAIDLTLYPNYTGGIDLSAQTAAWTTALPAGYTAKAIIENQNNDGTAYIAFSNNTSLIVGKVNADMIPIPTALFGTNGLTTPLAMATVTSISIDSLGNICVAGTDSGLQKAVIFAADGDSVVTLAAPATAMTVGTTIAQQKSGRYLVGGKTAAVGTVSAFKNYSSVSGGVIPNDTTFGPATLTSYYSTGVNMPVDDLCIDSYDYIYIAHRAAGGQVSVSKLTPEGALSTSANTPSAQVWTSNPRTVTGIVATQPARIAINSAGNILVGATTGAGASAVKVALVNGADSTLTAAIAITSGATPILTKLVGSGAASGTQAGTEFYGSIYDGSTKAIAFAVTGLGAVDTSFGSSGYLNIATATVTPTAVNGISVQFDGKVVLVGGTLTAGTDSEPVLLRGYGYPYIAQFAQEPDQAAAGVLDTTLWPTTGALDLDGYTPISTAITTLDGSSVSRIYEYTNGNALLVFSGTNSGADTVVARVLKDLTLDTVANGGSGFNTTGFITIASQTNANALYVDASGNIFVAGGTGATSWVRAYNPNGTALTGWSTPTSNLANGAYQIAEQTSNRKILAGKGVTNGTLYGYTISGTLDATFGAAGVVDMGSTSPITDIAIDVYDDIIAIATAAGSTVLKKVGDSGGTVTTLSGGTAIDTAIGNPRVILTSAISTAKIVAASATVAGFTLARYNNDATGTDSGAQIDIAAGGTSTSVLGNIYATSDGKVVMIGYETTGNTIVVVRLTSSFALDSTFGTNGVLQTTVGAVQFKALDGMICADDRIMIAGGSNATADPYLARSFGDDYVTYVQQAPTEGVAGTIDPTWGSTTPPTGIYNLSGLSGITAGSQGQGILPLTNGGYYMALTSGTTTQLIRTVAEGTLDTTYGGGDGIAAAATSFVVNSMMMDGSSRIVMTSSNGGAGKIVRYVSGDTGALDTTFGTGGFVTVSGATEANVVVEQTLARYVVAGKNATGGILYAYTALNPSSATTGAVDTTFNAGFGGTPGYVQITTGGGNGIYNLIADRYDRLIFAVLNTAGTGIDLYRLTPTGELDNTFGSSGKVANVITTSGSSGSGNDANSIRVALDSVGNIVVAGYSYTSGTTTGNIKIVAYDNGTATTTGGNGVLWTNSYTIPNVVGTGTTGISLTSLQTTADNYVLVLGNGLGASSTLSPTWIARLANTSLSGTYALDSANFNPTALNGVGTPAAGIAGIFEYSNITLGTSAPYNYYNAMTVRPDGRLAVIGQEYNGAYIPTVLRVYDDPYTTETVQSPDSKTIGTNDQTLGVSPTFYTNLGVTFYGVVGGAANYGQVARAIALQDDNNIIIAVDGGASNGGASQIFVNKFDTDGILNPSFNTTGQATVLSTYAAQNVQDMITFTTVAGVNKAIFAGYVTNSTLSSTDSLLLQYNLASPGSLDTTFGGFNGNPAGVAFGDGKQLNTVARQTTGRIVAAGITQDTQGLLLGYTAAGKLDTSFGADGYLAVSASTGLFTHAIDTQNRVVIAYRGSGNTAVIARYLADGSGLDTSFSGDGLLDTTLAVGASGNNNMRIALNSSNSIYIAVVNAAGNTVTVNTYDSTGGTPTSYALPISVTTFVIAKLLVDVDGKAIVVGYDTTGSDQIVITRTTTAVTGLDTTFNPAPAAIPGCLKYAVASGTVQAAINAMIHPDGRILIVGSEAA